MTEPVPREDLTEWLRQRADELGLLLASRYSDCWYVTRSDVLLEPHPSKRIPPLASREEAEKLMQRFRREIQMDDEFYARSIEGTP